MEFKEFLTAILRSSADSLRRNKLPASLSVIALVLTSALAYTSNYDERPRYRQLVLPKIHKAEQAFFSIMEAAEQEPDEIRRIHYFLEGHRRAKAAMRIVSEERPMTAAGRKAQRELLRYYELMDEQLAIIRTEMSFNESYDYISEWKRRNSELMTVRERWVKWIGLPV